MRVVLERDDTHGEGGTEAAVLATDVEVADSALSQARGLMFRSGVPEDYALVLEVGGGGLLPFSGGPSRQIVHMLFVRFPIDVVWLVDDEVTKVARLRPWRSVRLGTADRILELPAGAAADVSAGDTVRVETPDG
ncbi:MAG: DUF192 domain-containing protein [Halovenus sp.]